MGLMFDENQRLIKNVIPFSSLVAQRSGAGGECLSRIDCQSQMRRIESELSESVIIVETVRSTKRRDDRAASSRSALACTS